MVKADKEEGRKEGRKEEKWKGRQEVGLRE